MSRPSIDALRQTAYMKLVEYAISQAGIPFAKEDAVKSTQVTPEAFDVYVDVLYSAASDGSGKFETRTDILPGYISFRVLDDAQASAKEAKTEAKIAKIIAIAAIVLSVVFSFAQLYLQVSGDVRLDSTQVNQLVQASQLIEKSQAQRLDAVSSKIEETNKMLLQLNQRQGKTSAPLK